MGDEVLDDLDLIAWCDHKKLQGQLLGRKIEFLAPEEARLADSQNGYPKDWELWKAKAMASYR